MKPKRPKNPSEIPTTTGGYGELLAGIKQRIATSQVRAHVAVSRELNLLYWQIGRDIVERQKREGWGRAVIEKLAADIQAAFPGIEGFSANNVWRMRAFYLNVVDDQKRHTDDQPSIGLILCQDKKGLVAEYALRGMTKAIGVSEYQLTRKLPKKLKGNLPTIEEIEKELGAP